MQPTGMSRAKGTILNIGSSAAHILLSHRPVVAVHLSHVGNDILFNPSNETRQGLHTSMLFFSIECHRTILLGRRK